MDFFRQNNKRPTRGQSLPHNIVPMLIHYAQYDQNPQAQTIQEAETVGQFVADLYGIASPNPQVFVNALAAATLPVGGQAVYGASRMLWELFGEAESLRQDQAYNAIMNAALDFLRVSGVPPMRVRTYEWDYWVAHGGTLETWISRRPTPSISEAPISELRPGEVRRVTQLTEEADSSAMLVQRNSDGRYAALVDRKRSDDDTSRAQSEWKSANSLYELYIEIGLAMQIPTFWYDPELEPYFPLSRPKI